MYDSRRHFVTARLSLHPSEALKEIIEPLYRPSLASHRLARMALRSSIGVPLEVLPGRQFVYQDPDHPEGNSIRQFEDYQRRHVRPVVGRPLPLLSHLEVLRNKEGAMRLKLRFGLDGDQQLHLSQLPEFTPLAEEPILDTQLDLASSEVVPNEQVLQTAVASLRSVLGLNHPARFALPPHRRQVGEWQYAAIEDEQLRFRIGE